VVKGGEEEGEEKEMEEEEVRLCVPSIRF